MPAGTQGLGVKGNEGGSVILYTSSHRLSQNFIFSAKAASVN